MPYRQTFMPIVNQMKHATGRLQVCVFHDYGKRIAGYYLESANRKGAVGPDLVIHPGNTALSFNRDLRYHFCHLYAIGEALNEALIALAKRDYGIALSTTSVSAADPSLEDVAARISNLRLLFFPDEVAKVTPIVAFDKTDSDSILTLEETRAVVALTPHVMYIQAMSTGDGVTRSWRFPYLQYSTH